MKKALLFVAVVVTIATAGAQSAAQENPNQMSIRVAGYEVLLKENEENADEWKWGDSGRSKLRRNQSGYGGRMGFFEIGFNFFRSCDDSYNAYPASEKGFMELDVALSEHFTFNHTTFSTPLTRSGWLGMTLALGLSYNGYALDEATALAKTDGMLRPVASAQSYKRSKLRSWWTHIPLVLEINPNRNFFISAGGYADFMFWSDAKWKKPKEKLSNPYINPIQLGLTARVGFREIYFFGNYAITDFFRPNKGPRLNPYSFGLGFGF